MTSMLALRNAAAETRLDLWSEAALLADRVAITRSDETPACRTSALEEQAARDRELLLDLVRIVAVVCDRLDTLEAS